MRSRRITQMLVMASVAGLALFGAATTTAASPPVREPVPFPTVPFVLTDTAGGNPCGFEVTALVVGNKEVKTTFVRQAGTTSVHVTGTLKVRLTTLAGGSVDLNISGPTHQSFNADGSLTQIALGRALWVFDPGVGPPTLPRLAVISGRTVATFGPNFTDFNLVSITGHVEDICSTLAGA